MGFSSAPHLHRLLDETMECTSTIRRIAAYVNRRAAVGSSGGTSLADACLGRAGPAEDGRMAGDPSTVVLSM